MNIPTELVIKILTEFDGRFVWRNGKLIFIKKLLKEDPRYVVLNPVVPHPSKRLSDWTTTEIRLHISELKCYRLEVCYVEIDDLDELVPYCSITLWGRDAVTTRVYSSLENFIIPT